MCNTLDFPKSHIGNVHGHISVKQLQLPDQKVDSGLCVGGGPRVVVSATAFHARVRGSVSGLGGLKETKNVSSPSTCESQYCGEPP